jgi:hypothetical protein
MAPVGKHMMTVFVQYAPPKINGGEWTDADKAGFEKSVIDQIAAHFQQLRTDATQRHRLRSSTPNPDSRASHARSMGEPFIATGNTRPDDPVNTSCPNPRQNAFTSSGPNRSNIGRSWAGQS